jgi:NAD(P)-dependent dehydrogenase (short-subunit alcohol dehydrogenase family)
MADDGAVVLIGATSGIGRQLAEVYAARDREVVISGRDLERASLVAKEIGGRTSAVAVDLSEPEAIADGLAPIGSVDRLVVLAVERDENTVRDYDVARAVRLATLKVVGYTEVVHVLAPRLTPTSSIVLFGGLAKDRPYPGSTTITTVNGAVSTMARTLAIELAPTRVNALHPAVIGDSPYWMDKPPAVLDNLRARTPGGELITTQDVVDATVFLLENRGMNAHDLNVDGGWLVT